MSLLLAPVDTLGDYSLSWSDLGLLFLLLQVHDNAGIPYISESCGEYDLSLLINGDSHGQVPELPLLAVFGA